MPVTGRRLPVAERKSGAGFRRRSSFEVMSGQSRTSGSPQASWTRPSSGLKRL
jgi:hypothetical protein